jgi:hypothetical protein
MRGLFLRSVSEKPERVQRTSDAPHALQNAAPGLLATPHEHAFAIGFPHRLQNAASASFTQPHEAHVSPAGRCGAVAPGRARFGVALIAASWALPSATTREASALETFPERGGMSLANHSRASDAPATWGSMSSAVNRLGSSPAQGRLFRMSASLSKRFSRVYVRENWRPSKL